jgi:hypothetical protein
LESHRQNFTAQKFIWSPVIVPLSETVTKVGKMSIAELEKNRIKSEETNQRLEKAEKEFQDCKIELEKASEKRLLSSNSFGNGSLSEAEFLKIENYASELEIEIKNKESICDAIQDVFVRFKPEKERLWGLKMVAECSYFRQKRKMFIDGLKADDSFMDKILKYKMLASLSDRNTNIDEFFKEISFNLDADQKNQIHKELLAEVAA